MAIVRTPPDPIATLRLLRTMIGALHQSARGIEATTGVTNAQLFLLRQLAVARQLSVGELAERVGVKQNAVSPVLSRLIAAGLVRRIASAGDARRAELTVTAAGRRMLRRAPAAPTEDVLEALGALGVMEHIGLAAGLQALVTGLGLDPESSPMLFEPTGLKPAATG